MRGNASQAAQKARNARKMLFFIPFLRVRSHYCLFYEFSKLLRQESRFGKLAIVSLRLRYDIVFSVNSSDSGMSGTRRHIRLCHYTPGHHPSNGRVRTFPACLLNIDYVIRRNLSCLRIIHDVRFFISILALPVLHPLWLITCTGKPFSDE